MHACMHVPHLGGWKAIALGFAVFSGYFLAGIFVCPLLTDAVALRAAWTSEGEEVPDPNYSPTILIQLFP